MVVCTRPAVSHGRLLHLLHWLPHGQEDGGEYLKLCHLHLRSWAWLQNLDAASLEPYIHRLQEHFSKGSKLDGDSKDEQVQKVKPESWSKLPLGIYCPTVLSRKLSARYLLCVPEPWLFANSNAHKTVDCVCNGRELFTCCPTWKRSILQLRPETCDLWCESLTISSYHKGWRAPWPYAQCPVSRLGNWCNGAE